jgi:hypothetical protein
MILTFSREGEEDDRCVAADGLKAVTLAMRMLAVRDELKRGDKLTMAYTADALMELALQFEATHFAQIRRMTTNPSRRHPAPDHAKPCKAPPGVVR